MECRRRSLVRFVPFSSLHEERLEEHERELVGELPAPVQPAGYGMGGAAEDPAEIIAVPVPAPVGRKRAALTGDRESTQSW
jgi:hypothetical protein